MALLHDSVNSKKFDVRLVERNLVRGLVTSAEYEEALKKLPDDAENADWINTGELEGDRDTASSNGQGSH